ncbi:MAG: response regulator [Pirellulaceae bacterium]
MFGYSDFVLDLTDAEPAAVPSLFSRDPVAPPVTFPVAGALSSDRKILVVEDLLIHQKIVQSLLAKKGYQLTVATTGIEALAALEREPIDLVLMDVMMPEMDGLKATRAIRLREQETGEHLPIIAMTAGNTPEDTQQCLTAGMDAFVSKPIRQERLFATLDRFLAAKRAAPLKQ